MKVFREAISLAANIMIAVVIALFISIFLIQPTEVLGRSMQPTLQDKNIVLLSKLTHTLNSEPSYGDIVVIDSRVNRERTLKDDFMENRLMSLLTNKDSAQSNQVYWIKRVIGKAGDVLEFKDGKVYRNGQTLDEPYIKEPMITDGRTVVVPPNHVFVMGDNRNFSKDSRYVGSIPLDHVLGKVLFKY